jgi:HK97 family phage portal protein
MGDGYVGKSVIMYGAESIGAGLAVQTYASSFFGSGATLTGTIEVPGVVQDENQAKKIKDTFNSSYKTQNGGNNGVALLHSGAKFTKISAQPNESQMVETRDFGVNDIARWFRMPLSKIQSGSTGSSNLEQLNIEYVTDCLMPWFVKLEQEVERKLFRFDEMDTMDAKFSVSQLMRGDMTSTSNYLKTLYYAGFINRNDGRRFLDLNTITEDYGNTYYSPANMIPASMEVGFWDAKDNTQTSQAQVGNGGTPN